METEYPKDVWGRWNTRTFPKFCQATTSSSSLPTKTTKKWRKSATLLNIKLVNEVLKNILLFRIYQTETWQQGSTNVWPPDWLLHLIVSKTEKYILWKELPLLQKQLLVCLATQATVNASFWHTGLCTSSLTTSESRWRLLPWSSKLSVGLALGTWEASIPSAGMTFSDSSVPLEQWSCQPREEAQQCRRTNFIEAKPWWECYHSEEREITKSHQLKSSDLPQVSFFPTKLNPAK